MKRTLTGILLLMACATALPGFTRYDEGIIEMITVQLAKWMAANPQEKVYLHIDKPYYAAGDDIWFKAYITKGWEHKLSDLSGILNVELINGHDSVSKALKLPVIAGMAWGDFRLADSLAEGTYRIRAYTNYMQNAGEAYFFDQTISIGNAISNKVSAKASPEKAAKTIPVKNTSSKVDVQFFPEGGTLVTGIRTRVAFKAVGANGLGTAIEGTVTDDQNNEVAVINTDHLGMGSFAFTPEAGKSYSAKLNTGNIPLPKAADEGYVLNVYNNNPETINVKVSVNEATLKKEQGKEINVVAQAGGNIVFAAKTKIDALAFSIKIPKSRFPSGIAQFTMFSATGEPLNERISFIQNDDQLKLNLSTAKPAYNPREKVNISLNAKNKDNQPVIGCFSVAVIDEDKVQASEDVENTIISHLLLTSDIKGYIEKPNYYFININDKTKADLDVLMMTQGYRRFSWKKVMDNDPAPLAFQPERTLSITGHIKTTGGKPLPKGKVTLFTTTGGGLLLNTVADANGRFVFDNLTFADSVKFVVQARTSKNGKNVEVELDNLPSRLVKTNTVPAGSLQVEINNIPPAYLQNSHEKFNEDVKYAPGSHLLKEVSIKEKKPVVEYSENLNGPGNADQVIMGDQVWMNGCFHILDCLSGRLIGGRFPKLMILDGVIVDKVTINNLAVTDIQSIEVLRTIAYTVLYNSPGGVLIVTTKRGGPPPYVRYAPGLISYHPIGYAKQREFYSPQYDDPNLNKKPADLRSTIFWKPNVITDKNGGASFQFFNADGKGTYKVIVEGIDNDGNLGRQVFRYKVE